MDDDTPPPPLQFIQAAVARRRDSGIFLAQVPPSATDQRPEPPVLDGPTYIIEPPEPEPETETYEAIAEPVQLVPPLTPLGKARDALHTAWRQILSSPDARQWMILGAAMLVVLAIPFILRGGAKLTQPWGAEKLVILSPHNETIRREYSEAFSRWVKARTGQDVAIDWRTPGGTSEIAKVITGGYYSAYETWCRRTGHTFDPAFLSTVAPKDHPHPAAWQRSRDTFLQQQDLTIDADFMFGGGTLDFSLMKNQGALVPADASGACGLTALAKEQPDLFGKIIPKHMGGLPYFDPDLAWAGSCLSSFGIVYNSTVINRLGLKPPETWSDLTDPRYLGFIAVADPAKSGSVTAAFEMILQQEMQRAWSGKQAWIAQQPMKRQAEHQETALRDGWAAGLRVIQKIGANARYFTDYSPKVPLDVSQGIAAAGMCIDFYGRTFNERLQKADGSSRVHFVAPTGGTAINVDAIGLLRGAPHPQLAHQFLQFLFSPEGQVLWNNRPGTPDGPHYMSLRRMPVRTDLYTPERSRYFADPTERPYDKAEAFTYTPAWTEKKFEAIRLAIRVMCLDTHDELASTWKVLAENHFPPAAMKVFEDMSALDYQKATELHDLMKSKGDYLRKVQITRDLASQFRRQYSQATRIAEQTKKP
jgi:iron(III) transport system substrate-binding protein